MRHQRASARSRNRNQSAMIADKCYTETSGSCLAIALVSSTVLFMFVCFSASYIGTDIQAPIYPQQMVQQMSQPNIPDKSISPKPSCNMFACPAGFARLPDNPITLNECAGYPCMASECCAIGGLEKKEEIPVVPDTAFCSMFECPTGFARLAGDPTINKCVKYPCTTGECCAMETMGKKGAGKEEKVVEEKKKEQSMAPGAAFCNMFECPAGFERLPGMAAIEQCAEHPCLVKECCSMVRKSVQTESSALTAKVQSVPEAQTVPVSQVKVVNQPSIHKLEIPAASQPSAPGPDSNPQVLCSMFKCPGGYSRLTGNPVTHECAKYPCAVRECCAMNSNFVSMQSSALSNSGSYQALLCCLLSIYMSL